MIRVKRVYDERTSDDGFRVLVDRVWPRGLSKDAAHVDLWLKDVAPTAELRKWFGHDPARWAAFRTRYAAELTDHADALGELKRRARSGTVTLLFGAKDEEHNNAVALAEVLKKRGPHAPRQARPRPSL